MDMVRRGVDREEATVVACTAVVCDYFRLEIAEVDLGEGVSLKAGLPLDAQVVAAANAVTDLELGRGPVDGPQRAWAEGFLLEHRSAIGQVRQALLSDGGLEGVLVHAIVASATPDGQRGLT
jgi:hypothetical protein